MHGPSLSILFVFFWLVRGSLLTNYSIDDTDPRVFYNKTRTTVSCPGNGTGEAVGVCETPTFNYTKLMNRTMTVQLGSIAIPFTGKAVYVFFADLDPANCTLSIDNIVVGKYIADPGCADQPGPCTLNSILGYQNTSLQDGSHTLVIDPGSGAVSDDEPATIDFDGVIYSSSGQNSSSSAASPTSSSSTNSQTGTSLVLSPTRSRKKLIATGIGISVAGIFLIGTVVFVGFCVRHKRRHATALVSAPFLGEEEKPEGPTQQSDPSLESSDRAESSLVTRLDIIEARFQRLESLALVASLHEGNESPPPPAYFSAAGSVYQRGDSVGR